MENKEWCGATPLEMPPTFGEQEVWAKTAHLGNIEAYFNKQRSVACRRILLEGINEAFNKIPELDRVVLHFGTHPSIKDSITAMGTEDGPDNLARAQKGIVHKKFDKHMGSVRARVGQSREIWQTLALFFGGQDPIILERDSMPVLKERMFDERLDRWTAALHAEVKAKRLDEQTPSTSGKRAGPRL